MQRKKAILNRNNTRKVISSIQPKVSLFDLNIFRRKNFAKNKNIYALFHRSSHEYSEPLLCLIMSWRTFACVRIQLCINYFERLSVVLQAKILEKCRLSFYCGRQLLFSRNISVLFYYKKKDNNIDEWKYNFERTNLAIFSPHENCFRFKSLQKWERGKFHREWERVVGKNNNVQLKETRKKQSNSVNLNQKHIHFLLFSRYEHGKE